MRIIFSVYIDFDKNDFESNEDFDKKELGKIVLCDVQNEIYPELEKIFLNIMHGSGFPELKFNKKINFEELYKNNQN